MPETEFMHAQQPCGCVSPDKPTWCFIEMNNLRGNFASEMDNAVRRCRGVLLEMHPRMLAHRILERAGGVNTDSATLESFWVHSKGDLVKEELVTWRGDNYYQKRMKLPRESDTSRATQ